MMGLAALRRRLRAWARRHSYSFFSSLGALLKHRIGTLMTVLVLGVAMLLPLGLWITLQNLDRMDLGRDEWGAITVFMDAAADAGQVRELAARLEARAAIGSVVTVSPEEGMSDFMEASGFGASLEVLEENPLPWVLLVNPLVADGEFGAELMQTRVTSLMDYLTGQPLVDSVQFDYKWLQRLARLLELGRAAVLVLSLLFGLAVVVVVANTIRLDVAARAEEIEILALVGAGNSFIRQPFLYSGFWYGLMGGALALGLLQLSLLYLDGPLGRLLDTYGHGVELYGPGPPAVAALLLGGGLLGLAGAWVAVRRYLRMLAVGGSLGRR
jgi:cell division transport system permease protein